MKRKTFKRGKFFLDYEILRLIGQGGFADIYFVRERQSLKRLALKVERFDGEGRKTLANERDILQKLKKSKLFPKFYSAGTTTNYRYLVMEALGPSLSTLRRALPDRRFSLNTTLHIALEMLRCIEEFHKQGFVHRDIKPGNFLVRGSRANPVALIDFGLSRQHISSETNKPFCARDQCHFTGTLKYASPNAHSGKELGRRDDLISWWYSIIEMRKGNLPWGDLVDKKTVFNAKTADGVAEQLTTGMPKQIHSLWLVISVYSYAQTPDYALLRSFIVEAMTENRITFDDMFDWERMPAMKREHLSVISLDVPDGEEPTIPTDLVSPVLPGHGEIANDGEEEEHHEEAAPAKRKCEVQ